MKEKTTLKTRRHRLIAAFLAFCLWTGLLPQSTFANAQDPTILHYNLFRLYQKSNTMITPLETITSFGMTIPKDDLEIESAPEKTDYGNATATDPWMFDSISGLKYSGYSGAYGVMYEEETAFSGGSLGIKVKVSKTAKYQFTALLAKFRLNGIVDVYIAPENASNTTADQYKMGTFDQYAPDGDQVWNLPVEMGEVDLKAGIYVITVVISDRSPSVPASVGARFIVSGFRFTEIGEISPEKPLDTLRLSIPSAPSCEIAVQTTQKTLLTAYDADGKELNPQGAKAEYFITPESVAAIASDGTVKALSEGDAEITATMELSGVTKQTTLPIQVRAAGGNLLPNNPDFEDGSLTPWDLTETTSASAYRNVQISTVPKDGKDENRALAVSLNANLPVTSSGAFQYIPAERVKLEAGRFYELSFWVKVASHEMPQDPEDGFLLVGCDMYGYTDRAGKTLTGETYRGQDLNTLPNFPSAFSEWKKVVLHVAAPLSKDQCVSPRFVVDARNAAGKTGFGIEVFFDDFMLREVGFDHVELTQSGESSVLDAVSTLTVSPVATTGTPIMLQKDALDAGAVTLISSNEGVAVITNLRPANEKKPNDSPTIADLTTKGTGKTELTANVLLNGVLRTATLPFEIAALADALKTIALTLGKEEIHLGETTAATVSGTMDSGDEAPLQNAAVIYESSNPAVARIDAAGTITGVSEGLCEISTSVTLNGKTLTAKRSLTVIDPSALTEISVDWMSRIIRST